MFDSQHYIPILKWKRAEQGALQSLSDESKARMTPLVQFVMPNYKQGEQLEDLCARFEGMTPTLREKLVSVWGESPVFVDASLLFTTSLKVKALKTILTDAAGVGGFLIPTIYLTDEKKIQETVFRAAREANTGLCVRLTRRQLSDVSQLNIALVAVLNESRVPIDQIDLLVDLKEMEYNGVEYEAILEASQSIHEIKKWRTFTLAGGSFPEDLSKCKLDEKNELPRVEWQHWVEHVQEKDLIREPSFGDYTVQHPIYKDSTQFFHPTASLRYTLDNVWLVMKGQKQKFYQYLVHAATLVSSDYFYGNDFSVGDAYIAEKAAHLSAYQKDPSIKGTGSTETWLRAGINHHLSLVARQIANLA